MISKSHYKQKHKKEKLSINSLQLDISKLFPNNELISPQATQETDMNQLGIVFFHIEYKAHNLNCKTFNHTHTKKSILIFIEYQFQFW